jgi:hypothetical protein
VLRENWFYNVTRGFYEKRTSSGPSGNRLVLLKNAFDLENGSDAVAMELDGNNQSSPHAFLQVVLRGNIVRAKDGATANSGMVGAKLNSCQEAVVESNVFNLTTDNNAVSHTVCQSIKVFNNQKTDGTLLPGYDSATQRHDSELAIDVEDVLIGL